MVWRPRKWNIRKRKPIRRNRMFMRKPARGVAQPVQKFKRSVYLKAAYTSSTLADSNFGKQFVLNDVPNVGEFTSLYDQYRILAVKVKLIPRASEADVSQQLPNIGSVIDYDDQTALTAINDYTQYQNFKMTRGNKIHSRYIKPRIAAEVFGGGVTTGFMPTKGWLDVAYPAVPHYGMKIYIQQTAVAQSYDALIDYYLAFKNVR